MASRKIDQSNESWPARITLKDQYDLSTGSYIEHNSGIVNISNGEALGRIYLNAGVMIGKLTTSKVWLVFGITTVNGYWDNTTLLPMSSFTFYYGLGN